MIMSCIIVIKDFLLSHRPSTGHVIQTNLQFFVIGQKPSIADYHLKTDHQILFLFEYKRKKQSSNARIFMKS